MAEDIAKLLKAAKKWKKARTKAETASENKAGEKVASGNGAKKRIALLSSCASQQLALLLEYELHAAGLECELYAGEYGGIAMDVLDSGSPLYAFAPDIVIILPHYTDIKEYPALLAPAEDCAAVVERHADYYLGLCARLHAALPHVAVLLGTIPIPPERQLVGAERSPYTRTSILRALNERLASAAPGYVHTVDIAELAELIGRREFFDYQAYFWHKAPCRIDYLPDITRELVGAIRALLGRARKCLVLDLDNTLWGGVVGDLGAMGVNLDPNDAEGEAYRHFQRYVLALKERGVILAVCSKNDDAIARAPFTENPHIVLQLSDIACFVANWENKADNLKAIARTLNIGLDSLVFFDDNPAEREIVRSFAPEVMVIDVPEDPACYTLALDAAVPFYTLGMTREDISRAGSYQAAAERAALASSVVDYDSYLAALSMRGRFSAPDASELARFSQLLNKSNQFNLRTQRYDLGEIERMATSSDYRLLAARLTDKFSDYGLISCVILRREGESAFIDSWVMSCRVLKRGVENMMFAAIVSTAREMGAREVVGEYLPTAKNAMVQGFYDGLGFALVEETDGRRRYRYDLAEDYEPGGHIAVM